MYPLGRWPFFAGVFRRVTLCRGFSVHVLSRVNRPRKVKISDEDSWAEGSECNVEKEVREKEGNKIEQEVWGDRETRDR